MSGLPSLAGSPLFAIDGVGPLLATLARDGEEARIVGGAVRDALLGLPVGDVDFATTATPETVERLCRGAGFKVVPTGIAHGTLTVVAHGRGFEVTTLRRDVETDGRRAVVAFGRDWEADARRRDFTINALSVGADGRVYDYVGGAADIAARCIRFIGDPDMRIAEDRLRVLRLFRFHATLGVGPIDRAGLAAAVRARRGLADLSAERIGQEIVKLVVGARAAETAALMQESGILPLLLAGVACVAPFGRLASVEAALGIRVPDPATRLVVLACRIEEDVERIAARLRLSGAVAGRMRAALGAADAVARAADRRGARQVIHAMGAEAFADGVVVAAARDRSDRLEVWSDLLGLPERDPVPPFPLAGRDVLALGVPPGPAVGQALAAVEAWWKAKDFRPDESDLRRRLQTMVRAAR